jgi:hypothetical protein
MRFCAAPSSAVIAKVRRGKSKGALAQQPARPL